MKKKITKKFCSLLLAIIMVSSTCLPVDCGLLDMEVSAASYSASTRITNVKACHVTDEMLEAGYYYEEIDGEDFKNLHKKNNNTGISMYALTETVADTGLFKSSLTGLALEIYETLESVQLTAQNNGISFYYKDTTTTTLDRAVDIMRDAYSEALYAYEYDHLEEFYWQAINGIGFGLKSNSSQGYCFTLFYKAFENNSSIPAYTESLEAQAKAKVSAAVASLSSYTSVYDKLYYANQWVIDNCEYGYLNAAEGSREEYYAHSMMGLLIDGIGVCETYAKTYKILCQRMGIPCIVVIRNNIMNKEYNHAFNYVKIDGNWYLVDCTWNDSSSSNTTYFLRSNKPYIDLAHTPLGPLTYPETSTKNYVKPSHNWDAGTVMKKATCEETGLMTFHCTDAGCSETKTEVIGAVGHKYVLTSTTATCTSTGIETYTCSYCDKTKTENGTTILKHDYNTKYEFAYNEDYTACDVLSTCMLCGEKFDVGDGTVVVNDRMEPTCTSDGVYDLTITFSLKLNNVNSKGTSYRTVRIPATGHDYEASQSSATCMEGGKTVYTCTICKNTYEETGTAPLGHDYQVTGTTPATCTTDGTKSYECSRCNSAMAEVLPKTGHNYTKTTVAPTCTTEGCDRYTCSKCNDTYTDNKKAALGHNYQVTSTTAATCTTDGKTAYKCSRCSATKSEVIPKTGHSYVKTTVAPTCTIEGYDSYTCSKCKDTYTDNKKAALGHNYQVTSTTAATCTTDGAKSYKCSRCSATKSELLPKTGHDYVISQTSATCTSSGKTTYICSKCKDTYEDGEIKPLGHDFKVTSTTAATCTTDGVKSYKCSRCSETKSEVLPKTGHSYTKTTVAPTCTAEGCDRYTCSKCNDTYTDNKKAALGHDFVETERVLPLDGKAGYIRYVCSRCTSTKETVLSPKSQTIKVTKSGSTTAITSVTLNAGKTVQLAVSGAKTALVYTSKDSTKATVSSTGLIKGIKPGIVNITVKAKAAGEYAASKTVTIKVDVRPGVTSSLKAANLSSGVKLTWSKVSGATGYKIYCNDTRIASVSATAVTYTDKTKRTNGTNLKYKVVAYAANGDSTLGKTVTTYRVIGPTISSLSNSAAGTMTVKYAKVSGYSKLTGYQIQYSTSSSFSSVKSKTITKNSTVSTTIKSLTKGKTYYVRVRSYKTVNSVKYYSGWSAKKSLKITR